MSRNAVAIFIFSATVIIQIVTVLFVAAAWVPDFYQRGLIVSPDALAVHGAAFEKKVERLQKDASDEDGRWSMQLSDEQINGWLAVALPRRYPHVLPDHLYEPRIAIESERCHVACQYRNGATNVILTLCVDLAPSEQPNEVKLSVLSARIGSVPGREHDAVWPIAQAARRSKIRMRWISRDAQPEAIVQIPKRWFDENRQVQIEDIRFKDGHLFVAGKSSERPTVAKNRRTVAQRGPNRLKNTR